VGHGPKANLIVSYTRYFNTHQVHNKNRFRLSIVDGLDRAFEGLIVFFGRVQHCHLLFWNEVDLAVLNLKMLQKFRSEIGHLFL
jgi:hypothetical protein